MWYTIGDELVWIPVGHFQLQLPESQAGILDPQGDFYPFQWLCQDFPIGCRLASIGLGDNSPGQPALRENLTIESVVELSVSVPHRTEYQHVTCFMVPV